jgi:hypothetical protein
MNRADAHAFAQDWLNAWNTHDLEALLMHFADEVTFSSPLAVQIAGASDGIVHGKAALRDYWQAGLALHPDLHFELVATYVGMDTIVINFRNHRSELANEVLRFDGPLVVEGYATYSA